MFLLIFADTGAAVTNRTKRTFMCSGQTEVMWGFSHTKHTAAARKTFLFWILSLPICRKAITGASIFKKCTNSSELLSKCLVLRECLVVLIAIGKSDCLLFTAHGLWTQGKFVTYFFNNKSWDGDIFFFQVFLVLILKNNKVVSFLNICTTRSGIHYAATIQGLFISWFLYEENQQQQT